VLHNVDYDVRHSYPKMYATLTRAIYFSRSESRQATVEYYTKFYRVDEKLFFHSNVDLIHS
jgi:hypothetical protein